MTFKYQIGIIGIGRVGLPLALSLAKHGALIMGFDINKHIVEMVNNKKMPFHETGYDELIQEVNFTASYNIMEIVNVENIIITVGTPVLAHIETDLSFIKNVLDSIAPILQNGQNIILRSTVAPNTTQFVHNYLEQKTGFKIGEDIFLSFCPERIAEGKAMKELEELPQIIGSQDSKSAAKAEKVFKLLGNDIFHTNYISAELVKLFNNIYRYINFAVANQFAIIADNLNANIFEILEMTNYKYPRGKIPAPGLTAGTCLRKDFGMINETIPYTDLLLSAWKINEFIPKFLVENLKKHQSITNKCVGILGYTFKFDTDDTRDSLVPKLIRYIEREVPKKIFIHDPHLPTNIDDLYYNSALDTLLNQADIIYIAVNHTIFKQKLVEIQLKAKSNCIFVDFWNIGNTNKIFYTKNDLKPLNTNL